MAIIEGPMTGRIHGKCGKYIFYEIYGKKCIRSLPFVVKQPNSPKQMEHRQKLLLLTELGQILKFFLRKTMKSRNQNINCFNRFIKLNYAANAISGKYPDLKVDYSRLIVSAGEIGTVSRCLIYKVEKKKISLQWIEHSNGYNFNYSDRASLLIYNETQNCFLDYYGNSMRIEKQMNVDIPVSWQNSKLHMYFFFKSADAEIFSPGTYIGNLQFRNDGTVEIHNQIFEDEAYVQ